QYCGLMKERAVFINDLLAEDYLFVAPTTYDEQTVNKKWKPETPEIIKELRTVLENIIDFNATNIEVAFKSFIEEKGLGFGAVLPNFRVLVTGMGMGPSMFEICALLGKEETLRRIDVGLQAIAN
ncbi:MAG TPA: glutamate--tRNA ligase, partial [Vicingaceae bacterium]